MKKYILQLIILLSIVSCKKNPEACIDASEEYIEVGQTIIFTDCSKNSFSREWLINGEKYSEENISVKMTTAGNYSANLIAFSKNELVSDEVKIDFSVIQPTGKVTFWSKAPHHIPVTVTVSGHGYANIIKHEENVVACEQDSSANFILPVGTHLYTAVPEYGATWTDSVKVIRDQCHTILLE